MLQFILYFPVGLLSLPLSQLLEELADGRAILWSKSSLNQEESFPCEPMETFSCYAWVEGNK